MERGVRIRGTVRTPAGQAVAGATVAPVRHGGGYLTGDSRLSVRTQKDGRFELLLPASGLVEYNLTAHDGRYNEWRGLANGILPPMKTKPGEVRDGVDIALSTPCVVSGRVVNEQGEPVADRPVRAVAADFMECFDPETRTNPDGTFELRFVRAGRQLIQVGPFWAPKQAPAGASVEVTAALDVPVTGVILTAKPLNRRGSARMQPRGR